ncbi:hypothetical protein PW5551_07525 [Petrotoga sp. 9PW.55.5.1]|uniref:hypothetical protein n=1 Tax=Petrotoga sp. 9PW.55.5.1 TaxID=1308979 RepID=UPI000DC1FFAF|nr:hypothetical protein [Petrotoga sp. 9PW.55.5.1]RAO98919.1 hypothetical protein PW5551_07525 [Petrotoga sp. 9PW.55.5.1]
MYITISIILGLIPFLQFFIKGWLFFGVSSLILIFSYFILKNRGTFHFITLSSLLLISQLIMNFMEFSNIPLFIYIAFASFLLFIASRDERIVDDLKRYIKNEGYSDENWKFEICFFGMGQIKNIDQLTNLTTAVFGFGDKGIAFSTKLGNGLYKRFIDYKDIDDFGMFKLQKKQELYYPKIRDMFMWPTNMTTMHKPYINTYGLYLLINDETLTFYEAPSIIIKISEHLEQNAR